MSRTSESRKSDKKSSGLKPEGKGLIFLGGSFVLLITLLSFNSQSSASNWLGLIGHGIAWVQAYIFGLMSYPVALFLGWIGWRFLCAKKLEKLPLKTVYFSVFIISAALLLNLIAEQISSPLLEGKILNESILLKWPYPHRIIRTYLGGAPLYFLYRDLTPFNLQKLLSDVGIGLTFSTTALVSFMLLFEIKPLSVWEQLKRAFAVSQNLIEKLKLHLDSMKKEESLEKKSPTEIEDTLTRRFPQPLYPPTNALAIKTEEQIEEEKISKAPAIKKPRAPKASKIDGDFTRYTLPPLSLLNNPKKVDQPSIKKDLRRQADILEETLMSFGIEAKVGDIHCGPTITSFEVHPAVGVKVQKITTLENDIALNLQAKSIRIIAPIPGKAAVGVEIPSLVPQEVSFKEMLVNYQESPRKFQVPVLLGKTVTGDFVMSDLAKMPHCLIAGATGSGKSVCINTLILSILMNARPDEVRLLLVDPKKVELTPYAQLPHLLAPVITEPHGAYAALQWLVREMLLRYDILKQLGVRNISAFNSRKVNKEVESELPIAVPDKMPFLVAIIDEFADLMMASSSDLETPIARIAQMARAVGIHLILATQRPSREVITGLIKANFPTRIAFKVASRINSQIILDETGADSLLGNGDMLFLPPGTSHLTRAQGAYVSDEEISRIVNFICDQTPTQYLIESFDKMGHEAQLGEMDETKDSLFTEALNIVVETKTASTTYLQRKLKIGYARAASLMDELEAKGVIGPQEGSKPRRVLLSGQVNQDKRGEIDEEDPFG
ncbi:MAG: DNA translocase FtsK [Chlamydiales bacterium]|nr:DNA translocase FtsK [Chlamydiales bacterium]